ncbi:hypothetical protein [Flavobacterium sp. N1719]|uniref:hypothetical protein n=1 Tax=Flavobacterium sp. N1719 TaxID=2885633 RepID=UPI002223AAF9|nr:hypothetical protein [Flavobacterium sp. N1719]
MKKILTFAFTVLFYHGMTAQKIEIDSLIKNLNNSQLHGTCHYVWVIEMESKEADSLISIGKSITNKLIPLLDNPEKGIIIHCVLSRIWNDSIDVESSTENYKSKGVVEYIYNELKFYEKDGKIMADQIELIENKKKWLEKINE